MSANEDPYQNYLGRKRILCAPTGFDVPSASINSKLFPFQRDVALFALRHGKAAGFLHTGLGKGPIQMEWCTHVSERAKGNTLISAPLAVAQQFKREAVKFGYDITLCKDQSEVRTGMNVTNYERLDRFDLQSFVGVAMDECFAAGTDVQVLMLDNSLCMKHIEDIQIGDRIINACGEDHVTKVHRRRIESAVAVTFGGRRIISSQHHLYFTKRGWVQAQNLQSGDSLMEAGTAVSYLRGSFHPKIRFAVESEILRNVLLREMADGQERIQGQNLHQGTSGQDHFRDKALVGAEHGRSESSEGSHSEAEPDGRSRLRTEIEGYSEEDQSLTRISWRKRETVDVAATTNDGGTGSEMGERGCGITWDENRRIPHVLQVGHCESITENRDRSGRSYPSESSEVGSQKGQEVGFVRVDCVEILELGCAELDKFRDAEGKLYFYDLTASRHPSYSVAGVIVHNSGVLKDWTSKTTRSLTERLARVPYKLCSSATPSPNDHAELGTHAELLDAMTRTQMLAMFFEHRGDDTSKWELKGHGKKPFFRFVASWSRCLLKPSDLGYSDEGFDLPPLNIIEHIVKVDHSIATDGMLFRCPDLSSTGLHKELRLTAKDRAQRVAEIVRSKPNVPWLLWCNTDYEAAELRKVLPEATEVRGPDKQEKKETAIMGFLDGSIKWLLSKPEIYGWGLNLQHCRDMAFVGLNYSFELLFQAIRRCWRFGQKEPVNAHLVIAETEGAVLNAIRAKESQYEELMREMNEAMRAEQLATQYRATVYDHVKEMEIPSWLHSQPSEV